MKMKQKKTGITGEVRKTLIKAQRSEITEHYFYLKLGRIIGDDKNRKVIERIAADELRHYEMLKKYTGEDVPPSRGRIVKYYWITRILGLTFGVKFMERGERNAQSTYAEIAKTIPVLKRIERDEEKHEKKLLDMIDEERLRYIGSMVLGLNDALVELTGALAGFTFALADTRRIAFAGFITGIAASLSMAASEYLSTRAEGVSRNAIKASLYTGIAYVVTVLILIVPYLVFANYYVCLGLTLGNAVVIIFIFNLYLSVARDLPFRKRFLEMTLISMGVAAFTFTLGFIIRTVMGIDL